MSLLPEILVVLTGFLILILDLVFLRANKRWIPTVALIGLAAALASLFYVLDQPAEVLGGRFTIDPLSLWFKAIFLIATLLTVTLSQMPFDPHAKQPLQARAEFIAVMLFSVSGMMSLISSQDLISLYVSLELATIPLFGLTAWSRNERSGEGALKYLAMGALASALLLYGFGLLYGLTGQTSLIAIGHALQPSSAVWLAAALITAGVGFKLTIFPFHMWAPDAYEGAPTPVTAFLSVASKAAGLAVAFQLFYRVFGSFVGQSSAFVAVFAALTMTLGNLVAILQNNLKRFMAFSAISQAGYLILGFLGNSGTDASAMVFYMLIYVMTNLAIFSIIVLHIHQTGREDLASLKGLSQTNPLLSLAAMVALFGLAGIPPLSGFVGKFMLFNVAAKAGYYGLVALAAVNSTVSLYYYLRIVRQMYIEPPAEGAQPLAISPLMGAGLAIATLGGVFIGVVPMFFERIGEATTQWLAHF
ncbi:NADH-quinone oxidoreductase subunit N [Bdellovibrionota bacterium FG-1]